MTDTDPFELDVRGVGAWSPCFADWAGMKTGFATGNWSQDISLKPEMIPPRERRRAPQTVKMAVEVMGQACEMAGIRPAEPAVVFASAMGDMQITHAMCSTLADQPELVSPTRFHNSVHNAAVGYWSIATGSHQPSTAVAGHNHSGGLGLLEACVQCLQENTPVLYVCLEGAAPETLHVIRPSDHPLALALLLSPRGLLENPLARLTARTIAGGNIRSTGNDELKLPLDFSGNPTALLLPVFRALAIPTGRSECILALNDDCAFGITVQTGLSDRAKKS